MIYLFATLIGGVAGLRAMTAPAAISWAAWLGWINLANTPLSFFASVWAVGLFTLFAIGELISDQLPSTPSRKVPVQFGTRIVVGALTGAAVGATAGLLVPGIVAGAVGAVIGTYVGAAVRGWLAGLFGRDLPAALIEDVVAVGGAWLIVSCLGQVAA